MARKKKSANVAPRPDANWEIITEMQINGRNVVKGTELKISGERGRFRFVKFVRTDKGVEWVDVWGGPKGCETMRSFALERVVRVHYKNQTTKNLATAYKEKRIAIKSELEVKQEEQ